MEDFPDFFNDPTSNFFFRLSKCSEIYLPNKV